MRAAAAWAKKTSCTTARRDGHGVRVTLVMPGIVKSEFQRMAGYDEKSFGAFTAQFGALLEPGDIAEGIRWLLTLPPHVHVNEIMIRPTGQSYP